MVDEAMCSCWSVEDEHLSDSNIGFEFVADGTKTVSMRSSEFLVQSEVVALTVVAAAIAAAMDASMELVFAALVDDKHFAGRTSGSV